MSYVPRMFEPVGIEPEQEVVYQLVLRQPGLKLSELAQASGLTRASLNNALAALEQHGFVALRPGRTRQYVATPPDIAVEALVLRRQQELEEVRRAAIDLKVRITEETQASDPSEVLEIITGREAVSQRFMQFLRTAKDEVLIIDKPPYAAVWQEPDAEIALLERGVALRAIYTREAFEMPGYLELARDLIRRGEDARVIADAPAKLAVVDGKNALLPVNFHGPGTEGAIMVHPSSLLQLVMALFESLWERSLPIPAAGSIDGPREGEAATTETEERVLAMLTAGLKDESIARALGVSRSTIERRIGHLTKRLGAVTRFQAGVFAATRGWIRSPDPNQ